MHPPVVTALQQDDKKIEDIVYQLFKVDFVNISKKTKFPKLTKNELFRENIAALAHH